LLTVTLQPGVSITSPGGAAVNLQNNTGSLANGPSTTINANGTAASPIVIDNTANPGGGSNWGLTNHGGSSGASVINATNTKIDVNGTASDAGIWAISYGTSPSNVVSVTYDAGVTSGITSSGSEGTGIQADNRGFGDAIINASGNITGVVGVGLSAFYGLIAHAGDNQAGSGTHAGGASVHYSSGTINVSGNLPRGIVVWADGDGSATLVTDPGTTIIVSGANPGDSSPTQPVKAGITLQLTTATAAAGRALNATVASTITNSGTATPDPGFFNNPTGIRTFVYADAPTTVTLTDAGSITTHGGGGAGIMGFSGSGSVTVNAMGPINVSDGTGAVGILADSGTILGRSSGLRTDTGTVISGVPFAATTGPVQVNATNVLATGQFGAAISATAGSGGVTINIPSGGSIMGGWQADLTSVSPTYSLPATGVFFSSTGGGTATLINGGSIGALSDRALGGNVGAPDSGPITVTNNGTITGFVQFTGDNNNIDNNGTVSLRHFAQTTGNGVRDTLRVAVSDLGPGTFTNNGTLALLGGPGATALDATGQYLPLGLTFNAMALGGPVQGQILGATTFTNSGIINLRANPVPGDVLLISGGHTPGSNGGGTFISNGGSLLIDTFLNEGGLASRSDVLVVDDATVGPRGPTSISVRNSGGPGALTAPGNGILVVQGLGTTPGAFTLAGPVEAGAFSYLLFHGGVHGSAPENWYLRSTLTCSLTPSAPGCVTPPIQPPIPPEPPITTPPDPVIPDFRPAVPLYTALSPLATLYGFNVLGTLHERMGDPYAMVDPAGGAPAPRPAPGVYYKAVPVAAPVTNSPAIWGRMLGEFGKRDNNNFLSAGPDFSWGLGGVQTGFDLWRSESRDGARDHAGLYTAVGTVTADVERVFRELGPTAGSINMNAVSAGGYWTHYGPGGWYLDAVTQGTWYDAEAQSVTRPGLHTHGLGWAGSLEGGYPFALGGRLWLEPQAQLMYQRVRFNDGSDQDALVSFSNSDALQGRLGARVVKTWDTGAPLNPRPLATWLRGNLWHEFLEGGSTTLAGLTGANAFTFAAPLKGTWAEIGGGATGAIGPSTTLFATTAYLQSVDGHHQNAWTGRIGATLRW
jgi:autotransporter family porin